MNKSNVMQMLINNNIITNISIGSNSQLIEMNIKLQKDSTFILSESCPENILSTKFDEKKSKTYEVLLHQKKYFMYEFQEGTHSKDNIILLLDNKNNIKIKDFKFILANSLWNDYQKEMGGMICLILTNKDDIPKDTDFITQLKNNNIIESYVFMLDYKDNYNGILYIGNYFHDINDNFKFDDFKIIKAGHGKSKVISWEIVIEKIYSNDIIVQNNTYLQLHYEMGIIASPEFYHDYIKEKFFKNYFSKGICKEMLNYENIAIFSK